MKYARRFLRRGRRKYGISTASFSNYLFRLQTLYSWCPRMSTFDSHKILNREFGLLGTTILSNQRGVTSNHRVSYRLDYSPRLMADDWRKFPFVEFKRTRSAPWRGWCRSTNHPFGSISSWNGG